ncbi:MAG: hypothetical protein KFF77_09280, partial [Bacteroidetes bacterium]|nr:hypothetical protein [Bacteroidota bacterium]
MIDRTTIENLLAIAVQATGADEVFASLSATDVTSRSLAGRRLGQPHRMENVTLSITVRAGKRYGQASANVSGETEIQALVQRAIDIARRMPDVPEILPFPGTSTSPPESPMFVAEGGNSAWQRLDAAVVELRENATTRDMTAFGNMSLAENILALASSNGLFLLQRSTLGHAQFRCFTANGRSTGFDERYHVDSGELQPGKLLRSAADTCAAWEDPIEIPPGRITTIFEPRALADMLRPMLAQFSTRAIALDQSFLRRMDGSSFLGITMFDPRVTLHSDPWDTRIPSLPFTPDGEMVRVEQWVKSGVISQLVADRFEANEAA